MVHDITVSVDRKVGTDGHITVTLLEPDGKMFKRRAIMNAGTEQAHEVCYLVTELNGVRVYQKGLDVIVTTQDMYP